MKPDLEAITSKLASFFEGRQEVIFAYLFGSAARGQTTSLSDIDIAVFVDSVQVDEKQFLYGYSAHLTSCLMSVLETNRIDLVLLNEAPPVFQYRVFSQGIRVFCRDLSTEGQAFVEAFHRYQDTRPLRQTQEFYLAKYLRSLGAAAKNG